MDEKKKSLGRKIIDIIGYVFMGISILVMVFTIITSTGHDKRNDDKSIFGYRTYTVLTDSMKDTFNAGDVIVVKRVENPDELEAGDIITFISQNPDSMDKIITHKIKEKAIIDGCPSFITYGTTTGDEDDSPVAYNYVLGEYKFKISKAGYFVDFLKTVPGYIVCIFCPFCFLLILQGTSVVRAYKAYKAEQNEESEKEKIEKEKELKIKEDQNKLLLDQLEEMKRQLQAMQEKQDQISNNLESKNEEN